MSKPIEITLYIEPERVNEFVMDLKDANNWDIQADSAEDQAKRQTQERLTVEVNESVPCFCKNTESIA